MLENQTARKGGREAFGSVRGLAVLRSEVNWPLSGQAHPLSSGWQHWPGVLWGERSVFRARQHAEDRRSRSGLCRDTLCLAAKPAPA